MATEGRQDTGKTLGYYATKQNLPTYNKKTQKIINLKLNAQLENDVANNCVIILQYMHKSK